VSATPDSFLCAFITVHPSSNNNSADYNRALALLYVQNTEESPMLRPKRYIVCCARSSKPNNCRRCFTEVDGETWVLGADL